MLNLSTPVNFAACLRAGASVAGRLLSSPEGGSGQEADPAAVAAYFCTASTGLPDFALSLMTAGAPGRWPGWRGQEGAVGLLQ